MGSDCAKNCTVAAIANNERRRKLSLTILLITHRRRFLTDCDPAVQPCLGTLASHYTCCHVGAIPCSRKVTGVMSFCWNDENIAAFVITWLAGGSDRTHSSYA